MSPGRPLYGDNTDFAAPSHSPIAANQVRVSNIDTNPLPGHPSSSCFLPCRNESSSLDFSTLTQDASTSDNPPAYRNTTVSTKASAYKVVVATPGIRAASEKRRKVAARFACDFEGCHSDFTRKSSLHSKLISI